MPKPAIIGVMIAAVRAIAAMTPGTASAPSASRLFQSSRALMLNAASKMRPGRMSANSSSFVRCGASTMCSIPSTRPTSTRATVYGTRSRRTAIATAVAIEKRSTYVVSTFMRRR